ncbi:MAG: sigma-70 family RNA polymerase sigma factor [Planctomycetota bacterium]|nr:MAG: sigma-70 family RNA polymerase sigma factor [Planctomycetota bacterium]
MRGPPELPLRLDRSARDRLHGPARELILDVRAPHELVEDLFRHRYGRLVSGLVRRLGPARIDLAEDVVAEAFLRALRAWPAEGVPEQPDAWVFRVANNLALDTLRRRAELAGADLGADEHAVQPNAARAEPGDGPADDTLRMMFTCCHPALPADARVPLVLKTVCGFGVSEIAAALLAMEAAIAQRLTRGKARLQGLGARFEVPPPRELVERLPPVLDALYLMFNEGYRAHRGEDLVRADLVEEAVRLATLLTEDEHTARPEVHALLALMYFSGARLPARVDAFGDVLTLAEQDRSRWDRRWLTHGFAQFRRSIAGERLTPWHVEARIASLHAVAADYASTDWGAILAAYDQLVAIADTPVVRLNRAVALAKVAGPRAGLDELATLGAAPELDRYGLAAAVVAHLHWQLGEHAQALEHFQRALGLACTGPEARLLARRRDACREHAPAPAW